MSRDPVIRVVECPAKVSQVLQVHASGRQQRHGRVTQFCRVPMTKAGHHGQLAIRVADMLDLPLPALEQEIVRASCARSRDRVPPSTRQ